MTGAAELLKALQGRGFTLTADPPGAVRVSPGSRLTAEDCEAIGAHKPALLALLNDLDRSRDAPPRGCDTCQHMTRARICSEPVAAGLARHHRAVWVAEQPDRGASCPAYLPHCRRIP